MLEKIYRLSRIKFSTKNGQPRDVPSVIAVDHHLAVGDYGAANLLSRYKMGFIINFVVNLLVKEKALIELFCIFSIN